MKLKWKVQPTSSAQIFASVQAPRDLCYLHTAVTPSPQTTIPDYYKLSTSTCVSIYIRILTYLKVINWGRCQFPNPVYIFLSTS